MTVKVAINGFGRIGRLVARAMLERSDTGMELVAINGYPNLTVLHNLTAAFRELQFTIKAGENKPWADRRVRQAINFAINRQDLISKVYNGEGQYSGHVAAGYGPWVIPQSELKAKWEKFRQSELAARTGWESHGAVGDPHLAARLLDLVKRCFSRGGRQRFVVLNPFSRRLAQPPGHLERGSIQQRPGLGLAVVVGQRERLPGRRRPLAARLLEFTKKPPVLFVGNQLVGVLL